MATQITITVTNPQGSLTRTLNLSDAAFQAVLDMVASVYKNSLPDTPTRAQLFTRWVGAFVDWTKGHEARHRLDKARVAATKSITPIDIT